jgi:site-specific DNA-methyltransferase (adenine-specific)
MKYELHSGDSQEVLQGLEGDSIDSVVTDPPYGLSGHEQQDVIDCLSAWIAGGTYKTEKKGFMGKTWDSWVPGPEVWREVYRVLKPGGYVLAFAGTRTMDLMAIALRLAGFEYRDTVMWVYGSGFPKSHNIANDIDKLMGEGPWGHAIATASHTHQSTGEYLQPGEKLGGYQSRTKASLLYQDFGTALKPAWEPVLMFRKPIEGTAARNVLKWGTGGLNIGECRVPGQPHHNYGRTCAGGMYTGKLEEPINTPRVGRWPANLIHDGSDEVMDLFPVTKSGEVKKGTPYNYSNCRAMGAASGYMKRDFTASVGSAARFFYCSKVSKRDREDGLEEELDRVLARSNQAMAEEKRGNTVEKASGGFDRVMVVKNNHPTVKPTDLMQYLIRLVTPPGGTVLDPFMGSGSTGKAAMYEGFDFVGIELDCEYAAIAEKRIEYAKREAEKERQQLELWG